MKRLLTFFILSLFALTASAVGPLNLILTQEMLDAEGDTFNVRVNYSLAGATLTVPSGKVLVFSGGSLDNGEIVGTGTSIRMMQTQPAFGLNLDISGTWNVPEVHDGWFAFDDSTEFVSNQIIKNILAFSNDSTPCHIFFEEDRTYFFELPYKGRADLGNMVSVKVVDGKRQHNYSELNNDEFSFLRIFSISSNTHLTVNNALKMLPTNEGAYFVFWEYGKENITIDGNGIISGDNDWHLYDSPLLGKSYYGEWGHIFKCIRCKDFTFRDITISDSFGDCIYFLGSSYPDEPNSRWASNLTIERVKILKARRNGIAVGARNVKITDCYFEGCGADKAKGTAPRSAVDFEPDNIATYPSLGNRKVVMEGCTFVDNFYDVASSVNNIPGFGTVATTIKNCQFTSAVKISATYWMRFENCHIPRMYKKSDKSPYVSKNIEFVNCSFGEDRATVLGLFNQSKNKFTNCKFNTATPAKKL